MGNRTLAILKPDCVANNHIGDVITKITDAGFTIKAMKMTRLTKECAKGFYEVHLDKPFFEPLVEFMTSGPCVPIVLHKENAVEEFRKLIGATDPAKAEDGTIRKLFAESLQRNAVHGSDSDENAAKEISHFFSRKEILDSCGF